MTVLDAYNSFQIKFNKLDKSQNVEIGISKFVLLYNEYQRQYALSRIKNATDIDSLDLKFIFVSDKTLSKIEQTSTYEIFAIPSDYLRIGYSYSNCSRGECKNVVLYNHKPKPLNLGTVLDDEFNTPSFDFEETFVSFTEKGLQVFKNDFTIDAQYLCYYRYPKNVDIAGYTKSNGLKSENIDPETPDWFVDKVLNMAVLSSNVYDGNAENSQLMAQLNTITS